MRTGAKRECEWLTPEVREEFARLMKTDPRAARMLLARKAAAQVKP